ncbi:hypothetical protein MS3_00003189 [Schistosoma haematobium]|uniref:EF-hand domain-containing protein n=2 Tax=Schistosoma haematobium TaxID=6185 RepID=A0A922LNT9_SCHHA|nr:hypothetical protein MS3_00003189 [Schistosoma haematobium]KAH9590551.1 hypothetical protein MS3_00003189 [Schistosoma haematobium]
MVKIGDISDLFGKLDKNHNGLVSQREIKAYLRSNSTKYNTKEVREFVKKIDDNSDGQISLEELTKALSGNLDISKLLFILFMANSNPQLTVFVAIPLFHFPSGFQVVTCVVIQFGDFLNVCLIRFNRLFLISASAGSWIVLSHSMLLPMYLYILMMFVVVLDVSARYNRTVLTFVLKILTLMLVDSYFELHIPEEVRCIFNDIDKNHNGFVTNRELSSYFRRHHAKFNRNEVKSFICKLDSDGDGQISLPELTRALTGRY